MTKDIAIRSGLIESRYRIADGRFVLDNKDLSRVRFTPDEYISGLAGVEKVSEEVAVLRSANMSLGINTLMKLLTQVSGLLSEAGFDIDIVEKHHRKKVDAPSGTAIALAEAVNDGLNEKFDYVYDRSERRTQRPKNEIGLSAVRGGTIVGEHEVIFAGTDEVIELKHTAYSKAVFGKGALQAAIYLAGKPAGLYNMSHVIG